MAHRSHRCIMCMLSAALLVIIIGIVCTPVFAAQQQASSSPVYDPLVRQTRDLVVATAAAAFASFLVACVAVIMPKVQLSLARKAEKRDRDSKASLDREMLLEYINYFGEKLLHVEQTSGGASASVQEALRQTMPMVLSLIEALPREARGDATFAFVDGYRIVAQASHDDEVIIGMMESFNLRRREAQSETTPQTPQIVRRIEEEEDRFKAFRSQFEEMTRKNASLARLKLDELSGSLGGPGIETRSDVAAATPADPQTDRFRQGGEQLTSALYRRIEESTEDCIKFLDLQGMLLSISPGGLRALEIERPGDVLQHSWIELWPQEHREKARAAVERAARGDAARFVGILPAFGGAEKWWDTIVTPIAGASGDREGLLAISRDITKLKAAEAAVQQSEERYRALAQTVPVILWTASAGGKCTFVSERWSEFSDIPVDRILGSGWIEATHPGDRDAAENAWRRAMDTGEVFQSESRMVSKGGAYRWLLHRAVPSRNERGELVQWFGTSMDIDDRKRAEEALRIVSEAGRALASSAFGGALDAIARLSIPLFADWCQVDVREQHGALRTRAIAHADPELEALAQRFLDRTSLDPQAEVGAPMVARTGRSVILTDVQEWMLERSIPDRADREVYRRLGYRSAIIAPLVAERGPIGAITFFSIEPRRYAESDLRLAEELGRRAGLALDKSLLYEREQRVADALQAASLPVDLPHVPGLSFSAIYQSGKEEAQIGGDWYDAVRLADGRIVLSIGDVSGSGLAAAVTMSTLRQIIRGIAQVHANPVLMLDAADRALRLENPDTYATAFVGVFDPVTHMLSYASAGHPCPIVRRPDARLEELGHQGLPLGLRNARNRDCAAHLELSMGSLLILYTDGLTEATHEPLEGERAVRAACTGPAVTTSASPAQFLKDAILKGADAHDDIAILTMFFSSAHYRRWTFDSHDAHSAQTSRLEFTEDARQHGMSGVDLFTAEMVFGELLSNVARHAPGEVEIATDWTGTAPVLHVFDRGPGFDHLAILPKDPYSESGRGLFITAASSDDFQVTKRLTSPGSHARAVLSLARAM